MPGDLTSIQYEEVQTAIQKIMDKSIIMDDLFSDFQSAMNRIYKEETFEGTASDSFNAKFQALRTSFADYVSSVKEFADYYQVAKDETEATENTLRQEAEDLTSI